MSENLEGTPQPQQNDLPGDSGETNIDAKIDAKLEALKKEFNNSINKVVAKLTKPPKNPSKPPENDSESDSQDSPESSAKDDTIKALEAKYKREMEALRKEIEDTKKERLSDRKEAFKARLESQALKSLSSVKDIDDPEGALEVFMLKHDIDSFTPGSDGYIIFKPSEDDDGVTLEDLVKEWMKSKIGKRFIKVTLPNGGGKDETSPESSKNGKPKDLFAKKKAIREGNIQLKL